MNNLENEIVKTKDDISIKLTTELGSGGQGAVYKTTNNGIAVKMKFNKDGGIEFSDEEYNAYRHRIESILIIPDIDDINICTPKTLLEKPHCGYVMELLNDLKPVSSIFKRESETFVENYKRTGGYKKRIEIILELARTLNRLHSNGLVYGDISHNNIFISTDEGYSKVWLIDCDNLTTNEIYKNGFYTPGYEAPELAKGLSHCTRYSDCYSFAVLAYRILYTRTPFLIDDNEDDDDDDDDGWSKTTQTINSNYVSKKYIGNTFNENYKCFIPFELNEMFINTFSEESNIFAHNRPSMAEWYEMFNEIYKSVFECNCEAIDYVSFSLADEISKCPFCSNDIEIICKADLSIVVLDLFKDKKPEFIEIDKNLLLRETTFNIYNNFILNTAMVSNFSNTKYPENLLKFNVENGNLIITNLYKSGKIGYKKGDELIKLPSQLIVEKGQVKVIIFDDELSSKKCLEVRY